MIRWIPLEPPIGLDPGDYTLTLAIDLATASDRGIPQAPCAGFPVNLASCTYRVTDRGGVEPYIRYVSADDRPA